MPTLDEAKMELKNIQGKINHNKKKTAILNRELYKLFEESRKQKILIKELKK